MASPSVVDPEWIAARRERAASLDVAIPSFKGVTGWEFTPLSKDFSLEAFPPAAEGELVAPDHVLAPPEGSIELLQVDGATSDGTAVEDGPVVLPLDVAVVEHPELVEPHLGSVVPVDDADAFVVANERNWKGGAFVWVPRGVKVDLPILLTSVGVADGTALTRRTPSSTSTTTPTRNMAQGTASPTWPSAASSRAGRRRCGAG